ncbi:hypothetical protein SUGI_0450680 [Cryptomeria japonica]|nr:hypothetical protein SUGI_0450680 [Cryptomeria japonica]
MESKENFQLLPEFSAGKGSDNFTFPFVFKACGGLLAIEEGKKIHAKMIKGGFDSDVYVGNSLIAMYVKCGRIEFARQVFDKMPERTLMVWNNIISGYARNGCANEALVLFHRMVQLPDLKIDLITITSLLPACTDLTDLRGGKCIHGYVIRNGFDLDVLLGTAFIDMYAKCGNIEISQALFNRMFEKDVVAWNALISGYSQNGYANQALIMFSEMRVSEVEPTSSTMVSVLPACAHLAALQLACPRIV